MLSAQWDLDQSASVAGFRSDNAVTRAGVVFARAHDEGPVDEHRQRGALHRPAGAVTCTKHLGSFVKSIQIRGPEKPLPKPF